MYSLSFKYSGNASNFTNRFSNLFSSFLASLSLISDSSPSVLFTPLRLIFLCTPALEIRSVRDSPAKARRISESQTDLLLSLLVRTEHRTPINNQSIRKKGLWVLALSDDTCHSLESSAPDYYTGVIGIILQVPWNIQIWPKAWNVNWVIGKAIEEVEVGK